MGGFCNEKKNNIRHRSSRFGAWAILPDPVPFVVDDVIAGIGGSIALLKLIGSFMNKNP